MLHQIWETQKLSYQSRMQPFGNKILRKEMFPTKIKQIFHQAKKEKYITKHYG